MSLLDDPREDHLRQSWRDLVERRMPRFAVKRAWPVADANDLARILLDVAAQRPWANETRRPAGIDAPNAVLEDAIALGEAVLEGSADFVALNRVSLQMRGKLRQSA
ncbi:GCN5-related N-acetyltransferase [Pontivivens nitratireducens]|uniref:GCN5-related N-acetyltransferase n=1 Tax=Pontivivens nitratireducens TaxID=2758038 RepID=A0A6G7VHZ7_9RHOB|nr:GCN5-related N-acetyltransferase [Pontibrevibacter nitratireducens]QIK39485.1 GCN5-related N-acetyltransferase [Pontibrevibacter nitratireducens]